MSSTQTLIALIVGSVSIATALIGVAWVIAQAVGRRIDTLEAALSGRMDDINRRIDGIHGGLGDRIDDLRSEVTARLDRIEDRLTHLERERA